MRPDGRGYVRAPGAATDAQAAAWQPVTQRVHNKGGVFFMQLFHAGEAITASRGASSLQVLQLRVQQCATLVGTDLTMHTVHALGWPRHAVNFWAVRLNAPASLSIVLTRGAVHASHAGRVSHSSLVGGSPTVSASPVGMAGSLYVEGGVKEAYEVPRELRTDELPGVVGAFADAAERAVKVGQVASGTNWVGLV